MSFVLSCTISRAKIQHFFEICKFHNTKTYFFARKSRVCLHICKKSSNFAAQTQNDRCTKNMADRYSYLDTNSWRQKSKREIRWLCQSAECLETGAWGLFVLAVWRSLASFRRGFIVRRIFCALSFIAGTDSIKKQLQAQGVVLMDKISVCFIWDLQLLYFFLDEKKWKKLLYFAC